MSAFLKSALGILVLSAAMIAGLGQANEAQARTWGRYYGGYYGPRYGTYYRPYRYNYYRPYYGYGGYRYNSYYQPYYGYGNRGYVGVGPIRIGW